MGNTPSQQSANKDLYDAYIQQQQDLIYQQQKQINDLYQFNLNSQQMPSNMFFEQQQSQTVQKQQNLQQLPPAPKQKLDPYKILNLSKNFDETSLKKAYLKAAMKTHPDRGGTQSAFQQVSIAYTLLQKKLKEAQNNHSHNDLRDASREQLQQQMNQPKSNINLTEKFDVDVFNRIYQENKIEDVYDEGYGGWMQENPALEKDQQKLFQNGFNKDMFNSTFEQYKNEQSKQQMKQGTLVKYNEPETRISMANQDSLVTLGQGKITDFTGEANDLQYTDYKRAFTEGSTLIDTSTVSLNGRSNSINDIKSQRSNISYTMSPQDQQRMALLELKKQQKEEERLQRLQQTDNQSAMLHDKIHAMMLR